MKKVIVIIVFLFFCGLCSAQTGFSMVLQPSDLGVGLRVDQQISDRAGVYAMYTRGAYRFEGGYVNNHRKMSLGGIWYTRQKSFLTVGLSYHTYGSYHFDIEIPKQTLKPVSFDVGVGVILDNFIVFCTVDPLKWDVGVGVGIVLGK